MWNDNLKNITKIEGVPAEETEPGRTWLLLGICGAGGKDNPLVKVEGLEPMTPQEFAKWLWTASQEPGERIRPLGREPRGIWKAEEQSKETLAKMTKWREEWNKVRRKYPSKTKQEIDEIVREKLAGLERFQENWKEALEQNLDALIAEI